MWRPAWGRASPPRRCRPGDPALAAAQVPPGGSGTQPLPVTQMGQGVYGIKAPGEDMNTGFVVGDDGVFVFACNLNTF